MSMSVLFRYPWSAWVSSTVYFVYFWYVSLVEIFVFLKVYKTSKGHFANKILVRHFYWHFKKTLCLTFLFYMKVHTCKSSLIFNRTFILYFIFWNKAVIITFNNATENFTFIYKRATKMLKKELMQFFRRLTT